MGVTFWLKFWLSSLLLGCYLKRVGLRVASGAIDYTDAIG